MPPVNCEKILHVARNATLEKLSLFQFKIEMHQIRFRLGLCPSPRWGSAVSFPSEVWGEAPAEIEFGAFQP